MCWWMELLLAALRSSSGPSALAASGSPLNCNCLLAPLLFPIRLEGSTVSFLSALIAPNANPVKLLLETESVTG